VIDFFSKAGWKQHNLAEQTVNSWRFDSVNDAVCFQLLWQGKSSAFAKNNF
jgi:hypothetical protein